MVKQMERGGEERQSDIDIQEDIRMESGIIRDISKYFSL